MKNFYEYDEPTRIQMALAAIAQRRTLVERWGALNASEHAAWDSRAVNAAALLAGARGIVDFGCGAMALERYLAVGTVYIPVDVVPRDDRTMIVDFNQEPPPAVTVDACACLGLLEYLFDVPGFLMAIARAYPVAVVSYNPVDLGVPGLNRRSHAWVNDYAQADFEFSLAQAGWRIDVRMPEGNSQILWRVRSALAAPSE